MFRGDVVRPSHEGGLLISFTGSSPALGSTIETESGIRLGKVDTVLGSIHNPWVHVYPISKGLDIVEVLGQSTIISSKKNSQKSKPRREDRRQNFSRNNLRNEKKNFNDNDWICSKCSNDNFSWRERCNKCDAPKEGGSRSERSNRWGNRNERPRNNMRQEKKIYNDNDWICSKCSNDNFSWRERCNKCDAPKEGGRSAPRRDRGRSEGKREWGNRGQSDRRGRGRSEGKREWGNRGQSDRRGSGRSEGKREWGNRGQSDRRGRNDSSKKNNSSEKRDKTPKRLRGKSRSHFKNRELDDIFKKGRE